MTIKPLTTAIALRDMVQGWKDQRATKEVELQAAEQVAAAPRPVAPADLPTQEQIEVAAAMDSIKGTSTAATMREAATAHADALKAWHATSNQSGTRAQTLRREIEALSKLIDEGEAQQLVELSSAGEAMLPAYQKAHAEAAAALIRATAGLAAVMGLASAHHNDQRSRELWGHGRGVISARTVEVVTEIDAMGNSLLTEHGLSITGTGVAVVAEGHMNQLAQQELDAIVAKLHGEV